MMAAGRRTSRGVAYRCARCRIKRSGPAGLVSCPECGETLTRLYAPKRRPPPPVEGDRGH